MEVVVAVDTSGSIDAEDLREFLSEMVGIARSFSSVKMTAISADAEVHETLEVHNGNIQKIMKWKPKGGGGTAHQPVLDHIKEKLPQTKLLVAMTDGFSDINELTPPNYDVIWVINKQGCEEKDIEWGRTIKIL